MRERYSHGRLLLAVCFAVWLLGWPGLSRASSGGFTVSRLPPLTEELTAPTAVAAGADGNVYVAESSRNRVLTFSSEGRLLRTLGGLGRPISLAVGPDGKLFVGNDETGSVAVFGPDLAPAGHLGKGRREFQHPTGIAVDSAGTTYVIDGKASQVRVYGSDRLLVRTFGAPGTADGQLTSPTCLALREAAGELYVVDRPPPVGRTGTQGGARVQVFSTDGTFQRRVGSFGLGDGKLARPVGVQADRAGRLYVTDAFQNLVQVFGADGAFLGSIHDPDHPLRTPLGLALDGSLRLAVASLNTGRVERFQLFRQPHTVTVVVTGSGEVSPPGPVVAEDGTDVTLAFSPAPGHRLAAVRVERVGVSVSGSSLTLDALSTDRLVEVVFEPLTAGEIPPGPWTVTTTAGAGGTVEPAGALEVAHGENLTVRCVAAEGFRVEDVRVDGISVGAVSVYALTNVTASHAVSATFSAVPPAEAAPGPTPGGGAPPEPPLPESGARFDPEGRFAPTQDGTLVDLAVGLVWSAEPECRPRLTWEEALSYVAAVNDGLHPECGDGLTWRLPNANEVLSLAWGPRRELACPGGTCADLAEWLEARGAGTLSPDLLWSSTSYAAAPEKAWAVDLEAGSLGVADKGTRALAWPVATSPGVVPETLRTGQTTCYNRAGAEITCRETGQDGALQAGNPWPVPRFTDNGDGTATDPVTGVTWLGDAGCLGVWAADALGDALELLAEPDQRADCARYRSAYADWRLPTRPELYALLSFSRSGSPLLPEGHHFSDIPAGGIWVSDPEPKVAYLGAGTAPETTPGGAAVAALWPVRTGEPAPVGSSGPDSVTAPEGDETGAVPVAPPPPVQDAASARQGACFLEQLKLH